MTSIERALNAPAEDADERGRHIRHVLDLPFSAKQELR